MLRKGPKGRKTPRRWTHRAAEIILGADEQPVPCLIIDLSNGGARLEFSRPMAPSNPAFTLALFKDRSIQRDCRVVWTDSRYVGVKFVSDWYGSIRPERRPSVYGR
jgi:PilZ domain